MEKKIKVLCVKPEQKPKVVEIENTLKELQKAVGGSIQAVYTGNDPVAIVCNADGKFIGLPLNRTLFDDRNGRPYDIVSGTFLVAGIRGDDFCSLSDDMLRKYEEIFHEPEIFYRTKDGIMMAKGGKR